MLLAACAACDRPGPLRTPSRSPQICAASSRLRRAPAQPPAVEQWELADKNKLAAEQAALLLRADVDVEHAHHAATTPATLATDEADRARRRSVRAPNVSMLRRVEVPNGADGADDGASAGVPLPTVPYDRPPRRRKISRRRRSRWGCGRCSCRRAARSVSRLSSSTCSAAPKENRKARAAFSPTWWGGWGRRSSRRGRRSRPAAAPICWSVPPRAPAAPGRRAAVCRRRRVRHRRVGGTADGGGVRAGVGPRRRRRRLGLGQRESRAAQAGRRGLPGTDEVAEEVRRPGCEDRASPSTCGILRAYSATLKKLLGLLGRDIDLVSVIDDFGRLIYAEIDYSVEGIERRRRSPPVRYDRQRLGARRLPARSRRAACSQWSGSTARR